MKKRIIISVFSVGLLAAAFFGWKIFSGKRTIEIVVQSPVSEVPQQPAQNIAPEQNDQPSENIPAEKTTPPAPIVNNNTKNSSSDTTKNTGKIVDRLISWGFQKASNRKIDTIVIHSSYDALGKDPYSIDGIIAEYKQYGVSAHYLIARGGTAYRLVADQNIAWHAGASTMPDGRTGVNAFSIGVEMVNTLDGKFTAAQYSALNSLVSSLKKQYPIKYILGHSDIAPGRKTDPWNIDWSKVQK